MYVFDMILKTNSEHFS